MFAPFSLKKTILSYSGNIGIACYIFVSLPFYLVSGTNFNSMLMKRIAILLLLTFQVMTVHSQLIRPFTAAPTDREPLGGVVKVFHPYAFDANAFLAAMPRIPELKNLAGMNSSKLQ